VNQVHVQPRLEAPQVIEVSDLGFSYNGEPVLQEVNLTVARHDFVAVVGPNGGGKSTLIRLMMGLLSPQQGRVLVLGQPPAKVRQRLGYLPQHPSLDKAFPINVDEVVLMGRLGLGGLRIGGRWSRKDKEAAAQALATVGLSELARRPFAALSGGQRQRVLIARALATQPEILFLDEPFAGVDPAAEENIYELLRELGSSMTILMVSHDLGFVSPLVGHVICVNRTVATHPTAELTPELIRGMYGREVRMVRHDHKGPPGGCACE
jgi:zinc transport system ATP-binding protein